MLCENEVLRSTAACSPNPCEAGGKCIELAEGGFLCNCTKDRDGQRCEKSLSDFYYGLIVDL